MRPWKVNRFNAAEVLANDNAKATPEERTRYGLHVELTGILLGILPVTIGLLFRILFPRVVLPGSDFYYLTVIFIPIALVMAILRQRTTLGLPAAGGASSIRFVRSDPD